MKKQKKTAVSFTVEISTDDLKALGFDASKLKKKNLRVLVNTFQDVFEEQYFADILSVAVEEVGADLFLEENNG